MANPTPETTTPQALAAVVDACAPSSVVSCGDIASAIAERWQQQRPDTQVTSLDPAQPNAAFPLPRTHDLALISDTLEHLDLEEGRLLLGQLRNYGTHQIAVVVPDQANWQFRDFIALGFRRQGAVGLAGSQQTLYTYNLDSYNHKRQWNNARHWANPEMWGKAWW